MSREIVEDYSELETLEFGKKLIFEDSVRLQIRLCNLTKTDAVAYAKHVDTLRRMLPASIKYSEEFQDILKECIRKEKVVRYKQHFCGHPVISSEYEEEVEYTVWEDVFEICLDEFEAMGVSWDIIEKSG